MEFKLEDFTLGPTEEKLDRCKKDDLILIANFFDVTVPLNAKKKELKELLCIKLHERGLFGEPGPAEGVELGAVAGIPAPLKNLPPQPGLSAEELQLTLRIKEVELKKQQLEVDAMHLRVRALEIERGASVSASPPTPQSAPQSPSPQSPSPKQEDSFDVSRHIKLVPAFRETEVDSYFTVFERIAGALHWPKNVWSLLLQCKLVGKAQEVCTALSLEDSLDYDIVKAAVLHAYELVPEAYRQKFRNVKKSATQTYVEFAREKKTLFDKWCHATKVKTLDDLRELVLLEEFKSQLPEKVVTYLNEQKVTTLAAAAVQADEFVLTHKAVFSSPVHSPQIWSPKSTRRTTTSSIENRECYYCHEQGHLIAACPVLKRKEQIRKGKSPSPINLLQTKPHALEDVTVIQSDKVDEEFKPFVSKGFVSLMGEEKRVPVSILRDTGAKQSLIREGVLPFSAQSYCGADVLAWGVRMCVMRVPLHFVQLSSQFVSGEVKLGVRPQLPVAGIDIILGNDLAGCKVFPLPEVVETPLADTSAFDLAAPNSVPLFPVCAVTRAQARKHGDLVDLSDSFLSDSDPTSLPPECESTPVSVELQPDEKALTLPVEKNKLIEAQKNDESLSSCWASVTEPKCGKSASYLIEDGVLMRYWTLSSGCTHEGVQQIVVPQSFRSQVLSLAHDHIMSGHLGITKTYNRVLRYFFWPGLKSDVAKFCRSCHTCQLAGKPNQVIPAAPLKPIPVVGEPFEHVIVDCVGPLPKTKSGNQYLLTMMCTATRYPEAIPLRSLKTRGIVKALVKFFSTFGLPKRIQTDQGTNFMSKIFAQVMTELGVTHHTSSAYHPESQGALERFHQTLKNMLRKFCTESSREWDEGLPLLLFAVRETCQESLGFSPADLVFGHTVRGPLRLLKEKFLSDRHRPKENILDYVSLFKERLHNACNFARDALAKAQVRMKTHFDRKSVARMFQSGDRVLVFLPVVGSPLQAKFSGPYVIERKLSETDYVVLTPDRKKKSRVCHINMLKEYIDRECSSLSPAVSPIVSVSVSQPLYSPCDDGLDDRHSSVSGARLRNSEILADLDVYLAHLSDPAKSDVLI
ncbi:unnamed protein product [Oreochromis niloticus]|nr:unnamed protein product [Mustela putorius furo]